MFIEYKNKKLNRKTLRV